MRKFSSLYVFMIYSPYYRLSSLSEKVSLRKRRPDEPINDVEMVLEEFLFTSVILVKRHPPRLVSIIASLDFGQRTHSQIDEKRFRNSTASLRTIRVVESMLFFDELVKLLFADCNSSF